MGEHEGGPVGERGGVMPPFQAGDRVTVPGRYRGLVVNECWRGKDVLRERVNGITAVTVFPGDWYVRASFEGGSGWYEAKAHEFRHE